MTSGHALLATFLGLTLAQTSTTGLKVTCLDLQSHANQRLKDSFHASGSDGNNLAALAAGKQILDGISFEIGESLIQLSCTQIKDKPDKIEGIGVNRPFARLHILHAAAFNTEDNTVIGLYVVHFVDGSRESFEVVYGQDVSDWWFGEEDKEPARAKVAWIGDNDTAKSNSKKIRLYHTAWRNPHPEKQVSTIDFLAAEGSVSAPFCVAMTVE